MTGPFERGGPLPLDEYEPPLVASGRLVGILRPGSLPGLDWEDTMPETLTKTLTVRQWTPEWAFLAACRALQQIRARCPSVLARVALYADGSGELRIPAGDLPALGAAFTPPELYELIGSERVDIFEPTEDLVIRQCGGFAGRPL